MHNLLNIDKIRRLYTKACGDEKAPFERTLYDDQQISGKNISLSTIFITKLIIHQSICCLFHFLSSRFWKSHWWRLRSFSWAWLYDRCMDSMDQMLGNLWKGDFHETKSIFKPYESKNGRLWKANGPERNVFCKNEAMRRYKWYNML